MQAIYCDEKPLPSVNKHSISLTTAELGLVDSVT